MSNQYNLLKVEALAPILTEMDTKVQAAEDSADKAELFDGPKFDTIALMALYADAEADDVATVLSAFNAGVEHFDWIAGSTLTADGALVVDGVGGQWVSKRTVYSDWEEMISDERGYDYLPVGTGLTIPSEGTYFKVADEDATGSDIISNAGLLNIRAVEIYGQWSADSFDGDVVRGAALLNEIGGGVLNLPGDYIVDETINLGNRSELNLMNGGRIFQETDGIPIVDLSNDLDGTSRQIIRNGRLGYVNQQENPAASVVRLVAPGKFSTRYLLSNLALEQGYHGIHAEAGGSAFLGRIEHVTNVDCSNYGTMYGGGASVHTGVVIDNLWTSVNDPLLTNSRGHSFSNCQGIRIGSLWCDGVKSIVLNMATTRGTIDSFQAENNDRIVTTPNTSAAFIQLTGCNLDVGQFSFVGNTIETAESGNPRLISLGGSTALRLGYLRDHDTVATFGTGIYGAFLFVDEASTVINQDAKATGTSPAMVSGEIYASNKPRQARVFDGVTQLLELNGVYVGTKSSIPGTLDYPVGSFVFNSNRSLGDPLGWSRIGSDWVYEGGAAKATTAELEDITSDVNTKGKYDGKPQYSTATNKPLWASGGTAADVWRDAQGVTQHTPS